MPGGALSAATPPVTPIEVKKAPVPQKSFVQKPSDLKWLPAPDTLPVGPKMAILEGNPLEGYKPYTMRLRFPAGYKLQPHWHNKEERVTVISGSLNVSVGNKFEKIGATRIPQGGFALIPPKTVYFLWVDEETVIQLNGTSPWTIEYYEPDQALQ